MSNNNQALTQYKAPVNWRNQEKALAELKTYTANQIMSSEFRGIPNVENFLNNKNAMNRFINNDPLLAKNKYVMDILVYASIAKKTLSLCLAIFSSRVWKALSASKRKSIMQKIQEKPETAELLSAITNGKALLNRMNTKSLSRVLDQQVNTLALTANASVAPTPTPVRTEKAWKTEVRMSEARDKARVKMLDTAFSVLGSFLLAMQMFQILSMEIVSEMNSFTSLTIGDIDHMRYIIMQYVAVISKLSPLLSEAAALAVIQAMQRLFGVLGPVKRAAIETTVTVALSGPVVGGKTVGDALGSFILSGVDSFNQDFRTWILKITGQTGTGGLWMAKQATVAANGGMISKILRGALSVQTNKNAIRTAERIMYEGYELMAEKMTTFSLFLVMTIAFASSVASASEASMSYATRSQGLIGNVARSVTSPRRYGNLLRLTGNTAKKIVPGSVGNAINRGGNRVKRLMPGTSKALGLNNINNNSNNNNRNNNNNSNRNNNNVGAAAQGLLGLRNRNRNNNNRLSPSPSTSNNNNNNTTVSNSNNNTANRRRRSRGPSPNTN